ncbi:MAG: hypothetical protein HY532_06335 [Chloroflexi bacterium]|nr:hypothetical protein [Chloroflexota bacterium]MBI4215958.1 hypothetical protein [Chloroflexota bacterium]
MLLFVGGLLFVLGAFIIVGYAAAISFSEFFGNPSLPLLLRLSVPLMMVGTVLLIVAWLRERWASWRRETFKDTKKH